MKLLASLFVGKPFNILIVVALFLAGYLILHFTSLGSGRHRLPILLATIGWTAYLVWEWLVLVVTPEANIRVDLFVIWPVLAMLSVWALLRVLL